MPATSRNRGWAPLSTRACAARPRPPMDRRSEAAERRGHGRAPYSAARDPVFFAHHGNIERLWIEAPALTHALSSSLIFARIEDSEYALLRKILAFLSHQISHEIKITRVLRAVHTGAHDRRLPGNLDKTVRVAVMRPKTSRSRKEKDAEEEVLVIEGIEREREHRGGEYVHRERRANADSVHHDERMRSPRKTVARSLL
uniref:OSJNBa0053K19.13 protein n=1 Tax=Oryza sativa subsp. japonica TaxID=39947 RepID=Q7XPR0_ORYSJ|nr:OSJNBa0053K19.13 [Oryza sativa Japonica Group]